MHQIQSYDLPILPILPIPSFCFHFKFIAGLWTFKEFSQYQIFRFDMFSFQTWALKRNIADSDIKFDSSKNPITLIRHYILFPLLQHRIIGILKTSLASKIILSSLIFTFFPPLRNMYFCLVNISYRGDLEHGQFVWELTVAQQPQYIDWTVRVQLLFSFCTLNSFLAGLVWLEMDCTVHKSDNLQYNTMG